MVTALAAFGTALATSTLLTPIVRNAAVRRGVVDHALTSRKVHKRPIPRLGGIAIVAGFFAPLVGLLVVDSSVGRLFTAEWRLVAGLFVGGIAIAALGLYDDLRGANARKKFAVQFGVAAFAYAMGFRIDSLSLPLVGTLDLGGFGFPLTLVWIAGVVNALNLIDGLDGLAGGIAFLAVAAFSVIAFGRGDALMGLFGAALAGAVLGFLFFNFNPASIFMGDTGSMFLGYVLATTSLHAGEKSSAVVSLLVPIVALGLPIADTLLAMARRACRGVPLFSADRGHLHHRLLARGYSQRKTVLVMYGFTVVLGAFALVLARAPDHQALIVLALLSGCALAVLRWLGFLDWDRVHELLEARRLNVERSRRLALVAAQLRNAADPIDVWHSVLAAAPIFDVDHIALRAAGRSWKSAEEIAGATMRVACYSLHPERPGADFLELGWADGRAEIDRDTEIAIERLCGYVRQALSRCDLPVVAANDAAALEKLAASDSAMALGGQMPAASGSAAPLGEMPAELAGGAPTPIPLDAWRNRENREKRAS